MAARLFGVDLLDEAAAELEHEAGYYSARGGPAVRDAFLDEFARPRPRGAGQGAGLAVCVDQLSGAPFRIHCAMSARSAPVTALSSPSANTRRL